MDHMYEYVEVMGIPALFCNERVSEDDIPEDMFKYELRGSDFDPGDPVCIENRVIVNHAGMIVAAEEIDLGAEGRVFFDGDSCSIDFIGGDMTIKEFREEVGI